MLRLSAMRSFGLTTRSAAVVNVNRLCLRGLATAANSEVQKKIDEFVQRTSKLMKPDNIHIVTGDAKETKMLEQLLIESKTMEPLNSKLRPNSFLARTDPADVARSEGSTYICSEEKDDAGPTNNWVSPQVMRKKMEAIFDGCMKGRSMYVIPFCMGPLGSPLSRYGIQVTDSPFVVLNMGLMTRMGDEAMKRMPADFVPCIHSVGQPLEKGQKDVPWPCNIADRAVVHYPETREIWSFGSGYGGNSLLGKKCFALRIASYIAKQEGWLAEHMLILALTNPEGKKFHVAAAFPSACGKTNLAMLNPTLPGWKVECVGDDIAWMQVKEDGRMYAINPEKGFFGVAPGTSDKTNPNAMRTIEKNAIFTNVAKTPEGDVWWEGMTDDVPESLIDWKGQPWKKGSPNPSSHPNSRFTVSAAQCPTISPSFEDPAGVPIDAIVFGGRRPVSVPLVYQSLDWEHGVFLGSSMASQKTAAAEGSDVGQLRHDPFAMLPFAGYNMGDYFDHWNKIAEGRDSSKLPKIFHVNWFRQENKKFLWPGFGDNSRVLKWITESIEGKDVKQATPIGYLPKDGSLDVSGLDIEPETVEKLLTVEKDAWLKEVDALEKYYTIYGDRLPAFIPKQLELLRKRLNA